jgi:hypothetical protein
MGVYTMSAARYQHLPSADTNNVPTNFRRSDAQPCVAVFGIST